MRIALVLTGLAVLVTTLAGCAEGPAPLFAWDCPHVGLSSPVPSTLRCQEVGATATITGKASGSADWGVRLLVITPDPLKTIRFENVELDGFRAGIGVFQLYACDCVVVLQNVTVHGPVAGGQFGVVTGSLPIPGDGPRFEVHHLFVDRMDQGLAFNLTFNRVLLDDVHVDCQRRGVEVVGGRYGGVSASRLAIHGCREAALVLHAVGGTTIADSNFTDDALGVWDVFDDERGLAISNSTFDDNGLGVLSSVSASSFTIPCTPTDSTIADSRFSANGAASSWLDVKGFPHGGVAAGPFGATITGSSFIGNTPQAFSDVDSSGQLVQRLPPCTSAATGNWWASANGPLRLGAAAPLGVVFGDIVPPTLGVDPFLTSPP